MVITSNKTSEQGYYNMNRFIPQMNKEQEEILKERNKYYELLELDPSTLVVSIGTEQFVVGEHCEYNTSFDNAEDFIRWRLKNSHTPQDAQAIHQIAELFKQKEKNKKKEETTKQEMKKDPFEDKKVNATEKVPDDIESLF